MVPSYYDDTNVEMAELRGSVDNLCELLNRNDINVDQTVREYLAERDAGAVDHSKWPAGIREFASWRDRQWSR